VGALYIKGTIEHVKTLLAGIAGIMAFSSLAPIAFAAYNDVTLTTSAGLSVNGITLNVSGSSSLIQSITERHLLQLHPRERLKLPSHRS
jgi:hypothetical protein